MGVCLGRNNKIPQANKLQEFILMIVGPVSLRSGWQQGQVRVLFWVTDCFCIPTGQKGAGALWDLL